jgi:hypothetical protein
MLERGTAVKADTRDAGDCELDYQYVALLAGRVVTGRTVNGAHPAAGKRLGV